MCAKPIFYFRERTAAGSLATLFFGRLAGVPDALSENCARVEAFRQGQHFRATFLEGPRAPCDVLKWAGGK